MDTCHLKLEPEWQKCQGRVVLRGGHCKRRLWSLCSFYWTGFVCVPDDCCKMVDVIATRCDGQAADAVSAPTQVKLEDGPRLLKISTTEYPDVCLRLPQHKWPNSWEKFEDPVVLLERNLYGHPLARLLWERQFEEALSELGWDKIPNWECKFFHLKQGLFLSVYVDFRDVLSVCANRMKQSLNSKLKCMNHVFLLEQQKNYRDGENLTQKPKRGPTTWKDMRKKCVDRYCEQANKKMEQLYKVSSPCLDDHQFTLERLEPVGELSEVCSQMVLKCLYLARIGRPGILWSINKLARSVTKWTQACDKRLARLHTNHYHQYCHVGNTAQYCRLGLFKDSEFAGDLEDSKSTSGGVFRSRQLDVQEANCCLAQFYRVWNHFSGCWRMDGLPALDLWDTVIEVLRSTKHDLQPKHTSLQETGATLHSKTKAQKVKRR